MPQRAWAIDDLIIADGENLDARLTNSIGLPAATAQYSSRYGRWPAIGGLSRPGHRMTLKTFLKHSTPAARKAARMALLQYLNPELEQTRRLTVVDEVLPGVRQDGVLLSLGPWDVYADSAGDWHVRDLLRSDDVEGGLSGGWWTGLGEGVQIAGATTNLEPNPSFETNTTGWSVGGSNTIARSSEQAKYGSYSARCVYQDNGNLVIDSITLTAAAHSLSAWVYIPSDYDGTQIQLHFSGFTGGTGTAYADANMALVDQWQLVAVPDYTPDAGDLSGFLILWETGTPTAGKHVYLDAVQCEAKAYPTPYCDGSLGNGHSWSGTAHASTSSRAAAGCDLDDHVDLISENDALSFHLRFVAEYDADGDWPDDAILFDARGASDNHRIYVEFEDSDDKFHVYVNGADRFQSSTQTFERGDEVDLILTLDFENDSYKLYVDGSLDGSDTTSLDAPTLTAWRLGSDYSGANQANCTYLIYQVFDHVVSAAEVALMATQDLNARWINVLCEAALPWAPGGITTDRGIVATLAVDKEVRWRQRVGDIHFWRVYDDMGETTVEVESDDDVYPILRLTPKTAKTGDYAYRRWVPVIWTLDEAYTNYPYMLGPFDTAALVSAGKAQSDGDDWRILVDGAEVDRWFGDSGTAQFNQTATKTWVILTFQAGQQATLEAAIGSGDTVDSIDVNEDISGFPSSGILLLDNGSNTEAFTYTGKNDAERRFTGVTRSAKGTTARSFSASDDVYWIQHDIWIQYGNASASAPSQDDDYKPMFNLGDSTNTSWDYEDFGEGSETANITSCTQAGAWIGYRAFGSGSIPAIDVYSGNHGAVPTDPWVEIGLRQYSTSASVKRWYAHNPCGILSANFQNGEKYIFDTTKQWSCKVQSSEDASTWSDEYDIPIPSVNTTWESWNRNETLDTGATYVALYIGTVSDANGYRYCEAADVTLTLDSSNTPTHEIGDEIGNYNLACTLENETTGDSIEIEATLGLDETLEVDTYKKTVTLLEDGTSQMQALTLVGGARRDWLRLVDGENDLTFSDTGTEELEIDILWDRRLFE